MFTLYIYTMQSRTVDKFSQQRGSLMYFRLIFDWDWLKCLLTFPCSSLLGGLPYEFKVVIAGNHELTFDKDFMAELVKQDYYRFPSVSKLKPEDFDNVQSLLTNCVYLQDSDVTIKGFRIYGTPW